jgi:hypothetical protein
MDAPKGRYRVIEKDGRLIVIDNLSGDPVSSSMPPPRASGGPGASPRPVIAAGKTMVDTLADHLLELAVHEWDGEGRAVVRWRWKESGREKRWDAALDRDQQRRLGRGLLAFLAAPVFVIVMIFADLEALVLPILALTGLCVARGVWTINRLMAETGGRRDGSA